MGKSKTKKFNKRNSDNPTGLKSLKDFEEAIEAGLAAESEGSKSSEQNTLENILQELQSGNEDTQMRALLGIGCLGNAELDRDAIRTISPLLVGTSSAMQLAAVNALRMNVLSAGVSAADLMIENDVMTPLATLLSKESDSLFGGKPKTKNQPKTEIFIVAVRFLWSLCENSEAALQHANNPNILEILVAALQSSDKSLAIPAAQCLQTISEDNPKAIKHLTKLSDYFNSVLGLENSEPDFLHLQTLIAGLIVNINYGLISRIVPATNGLLLAALSRCLSQDIGSTLLKEDSEAKPQKNPEKLAVEVGHVIDGQICALEIIANISTNDDDDEGMEVSEGSEDALSESDVWEEDLACNFQSHDIPQTMPVEVHEAFLSHGMLAQIMNKTQTVPAELLTPLGGVADQEDIPSRLRKLQCRALLSLHNLLRCLSLEELGGQQQLGEAWKTLTTKIGTEWLKDDELLEASTTSLRALATRVAEADAPYGTYFVTLFTDSDLDIFCGIADQCKDPGVRVNCFRVLASVAVIVSANFSEQNAPVLMIVGKFLLEQSSRETDVWVTAEALDALMDALSEDCSDEACVKMQLVQNLRAILPTLQRKIRANRKSLGGHLAVVNTVKANLARFIKYKAERLK